MSNKKYKKSKKTVEKSKKKKKKSRFGASLLDLMEDASHNMKKSRSKTSKNKRRSTKKKKKSAKRKSRVIKTPRVKGGVLPLLPILAGIGALGSVIGSATGVVRTLKDIKSTKEMLLENARHNRAMENKMKGAGLYLNPYSRSAGNGLYLNPNSNSKNSR